MKKGSIKFRINHNQQLRIEAQLVNNTLWLTKHEIADFFNIFVNAVTSNLHIIFKNRLLEEEKVTQTYTYEDKGCTKELTLYNLEVLTHISFQVASLEAQAFRQWVNNALYTFASPKCNTITLAMDLPLQYSTISLN